MGKRDSLQKVLLRAQQENLSGVEIRRKSGRAVLEFLIVRKKHTEDTAAAEDRRRRRK
jgi:hypothetical protein